MRMGQIQEFRSSPAVALVRCEGYEPARVERAVGDLLGLLGGLAPLVAGKGVLLKPNFLVPRAIERAVNTHPLVIRAVALAALEAGARRVVVADSPSFGSGRRVAAKLGLPALLEPLGVAVEELDDPVEVRRPGSRYPAFFVSRKVLEAEAVLNLAKCKTHGLCGLTLAVKNCFGAVVGTDKAAWHARVGRDAASFAGMLVEVCRVVRPVLSLVDGVVGMDGNGPSGGRARPLGFLAAGLDPFTLDRALARLLGVEEDQVLTFGPDGEPDLSNLEVRGEPLEGFRPEGWEMPRRLPRREGAHPISGPQGALGKFFFHLLRMGVSPAPRFDRRRCTRCGQCLEVCHSRALAWGKDGGHPSGKRVVLDREACIRCYCCQEICPESAIRLSTGLLGRKKS
jgi:uncharacterized protein (DUF362 family)/NAD-dependent dihydropyrimidine dehydrogenase PreA subunit